jgi:hypothetical protein
MHRIIANRDAKQARLHQHRFFRLVEDDALPLEQKLNFAPIMAIFVMNFRDMNKWVIRFQQPDSTYESVINGGTVEDETHSKLFLEDWRKLHLDDRLGWSASDVIWWLFLSDETESFRYYGIEFMRLCVEDGGDPAIRFCHSESGEACGNVFFRRVSPVADRLAESRGVTYRYFGTFHLDLEDGHVLESEDIFDQIALNEQQFHKGLELSDRMFGIFDGIHECFARYVENHVLTGIPPAYDRRPRIAANDRTPVEIIGNAQRAPWVHDSQRDLQAHLQARKIQAADHGFYHWLRDREDIPAVKRLRRFVPLWLVDIMGYRDLQKYALCYGPTRDVEQRLINAITEELSSHSVLFIEDWRQLDLDRQLRWMGSDALEFIFLHPFMDKHRENLIRFGMEALRERDPIIRFWFMNALEASGHAFFEATRRVALQAERETGIVLDYLANRHDGAHSNEHLVRQAIEHFNAAALSPAQNRRILELIDLVFDRLERNLDLSLLAVQENIFAIR